MVPVPHTRGALIHGLGIGASLGLAAGLFYVPWLGKSLAVAVGCGFALMMGAAFIGAALRSQFGSRQGLVSAASVLLMLVVLGAGAASAAAVLAGRVADAPWLATSTAAALVACTAASARRSLRDLSAGAADRWLHAAVDWSRGTVAGADEVTAPQAPSLWRSPWFVAALVPNIGVLLRGFGLEPPWIVSACALLIALAGCWLGFSHLGPLLGRALYLRAQEAQRGVHLVHRGYAELQALRRGWWLTRWAAPRD